MTPDQLTAAWKLLRATDNSFISPLEVAQLKDWLRVSLKAVEAEQAALANERTKVRQETLEEAAQIAENCNSAALNNFIWEAAQRGIAEEIREAMGEKPTATDHSYCEPGKPCNYCEAKNYRESEVK